MTKLFIAVLVVCALALAPIVPLQYCVDKVDQSNYRILMKPCLSYEWQVVHRGAKSPGKAWTWIETQPGYGAFLDLSKAKNEVQMWFKALKNF
jgi:hypothetical protein